jgi:hypothetical protein
MEISMRGLWTMIHGMGFGALYLMACSGALVELRRRHPSHNGEIALNESPFLRNYLIAMAAFAWLAVLSGAYIIYPWYRAIAPPGISILGEFPQTLLKSNPATAGWHFLGMEWKEYVAWLTPISITMAAAVVSKYGGRLRSYPQLRGAVLCFVIVSLITAGIAGFFGAMLNKHAPVEGGQLIRIFAGE